MTTATRFSLVARMLKPYYIQFYSACFVAPLWYHVSARTSRGTDHWGCSLAIATHRVINTRDALAVLWHQEIALFRQLGVRKEVVSMKNDLALNCLDVLKLGACT